MKIKRRVFIASLLSAGAAALVGMLFETSLHRSAIWHRQAARPEHPQPAGRLPPQKPTLANPTVTTSASGQIQPRPDVQPSTKLVFVPPVSKPKVGSGTSLDEANGVQVLSLDGREFKVPRITALQDVQANLKASSLQDRELALAEFRLKAMADQVYAKNLSAGEAGKVLDALHASNTIDGKSGYVFVCEVGNAACRRTKTISDAVQNMTHRYSVVTAAARSPNIVSVLYGTDRSSVITKTGLDYSGDRANRLEVGEVEVSVPKSHVPGKVERPGFLVFSVDADPAKHFVIIKAPIVMSERDFTARAAQLSREGSGLLFIHGYNQAFDTGLYRAAQLAYDFQIKGPVFYYSWPSRAQLLAYDYDVDSAEQATAYLQRFLNLIFKDAGVRHLHIVAHSRGNTLLLKTLANMTAANQLGTDCCGQLIMASPDVDRDYARNVVPSLASRFMGLTLYVNDKDKALAVSKFKAGGVPRLGELQENAWPLILKGMDSIDATAAKEDPLGLDHDLYVANSVLLFDMDALIERGQRPPDARTPTFRPVQATPSPFWRLAP